jgi:hypothetical protein
LELAVANILAPAECIAVLADIVVQADTELLGDIGGRVEAEAHGFVAHILCEAHCRGLAKEAVARFAGVRFVTVFAGVHSPALRCATKVQDALPNPRAHFDYLSGQLIEAQAHG